MDQPQRNGAVEFPKIDTFREFLGAERFAQDCVVHHLLINRFGLKPP